MQKAGAYAAADFQTIAIRQHQVEDDGVDRLSPVQCKPARPAFCMNHVEARLAEVLAHHVGKTGIIFDQKNPLGHDDSSSGLHQP